MTKRLAHILRFGIVIFIGVTVLLWILLQQLQQQQQQQGSDVHHLQGRSSNLHNFYHQNHDDDAVVVGGSSSSSSFLSDNRMQRTVNHHDHDHLLLHQDKNIPRIAIVLPFIGQGTQSVPPYLGLFCTAAVGASSIADFLLIHNGVLDYYYAMDELCPPNVKFISLQTMEAFSERLLRVMDDPQDEEKPTIEPDTRQVLSRILTRHLLSYPYALVEFKPTYGHVFQEFLNGYSHWGYSDLDILFGDLGKWITTEELHDFDIVTYGYGDQNRLYLRGQFTIHKNNDNINQLWRECDYLTKLDQRFANVLTGKSKLHFESAEGCYSAVVLQRQDLRVKYAVKAFTDIDSNDTVNSHGIYIGIHKPTSRSIIYKASNHVEGNVLTRLGSSSSMIMNDPVVHDPHRFMQQEVGDRQLVQFNNDDHSKEPCMYWAQAKYQSHLCADNVTETDTVFWIDGKLYKQRHENAILETNVITAPLFHFQEWKRYYREAQLATFHHSMTDDSSSSSSFATFVLTKEGAIPLYPSPPVALGGAAAMVRTGGMTPAESRQQQQQDRRGGGLDVVQLQSPLGVYLPKWNGVHHDKRNQLPQRRYCLRSAPRKFPPEPPAPECQLVVSWRDTEAVQILSGAPSWKNNHLNMNLDVTLVLTLQVTAKQANNLESLSAILDIVSASMNRWHGQPCVLVIHVAGATIEAVSLIRNRLANTATTTTSSGGGGAADVRGGGSGVHDDGDGYNSYPQRQHGRNSNSNSNDDLSSSSTQLQPWILDNCLVAVIYREEPDFVSRKALLNMAIDAVPTRWYVSGLEVERGLTLSMDTAFFSHRAARSHKNLPGNIFFIPQFALARHNDRITLANLLAVKSSGDVLEPSKFEEGICDEENNNNNAEEYDSTTTTNNGREPIIVGGGGGAIMDNTNSDNHKKKRSSDAFEPLVDIWWKLLKDMVVIGTKTIQEISAIKKRASVQYNVELSLVELLMTSKHYQLFALDISPIFLIDNVGPRPGMFTFEIVREVEEFGGKRCYNGLKPAQLATFGYVVNVLIGAFAASTVPSRRVAYYGASSEDNDDDEHEPLLGGSRCDGCFMFDDEHEVILEGIAKDERHRPAKAAILWEESSS